MALYIIGLGLNDENDITLKGIELVRKADFVYLECYTSRLNVPVSYLEKLYSKKIILANREMVEKEAEKTILKNANASDVAFLVVGDALTATTHIDLLLRARKLGIKTQVVHNASIFTALAVTGLQLYKFGKATSIPFENETVETPYNLLKENQSIDAHTLVLLDLKPDENRYMGISDAIRYLLKIELRRNEKVFTGNTLCIGCSRIGSLDEKIAFGKASRLLKENFSLPMQCLIVPGKLHFIEEEAIRRFAV